MTSSQTPNPTPPTPPDHPDLERPVQNASSGPGAPETSISEESSSEKKKRWKKALAYTIIGLGIGSGILVAGAMLLPAKVLMPKSLGELSKAEQYYACSHVNVVAALENIRKHAPAVAAAKTQDELNALRPRMDSAVDYLAQSILLKAASERETDALNAQPIESEPIAQLVLELSANPGTSKQLSLACARQSLDVINLPETTKEAVDLAYEQAVESMPIFIEIEIMRLAKAKKGVSAPISG